MTVKKGTTFYSTFGDANAKWVAVEIRAGDVWNCVISEDDKDYAGTEKAFTKAEIERSIKAAKFFDTRTKDLASFWASMPAGTVMHADLGWGKFVRGVSELGQSAHGEGMHFKPTALVGTWPAGTLPAWRDSGFLQQGDRWIKNIEDGALLRFGADQIVEAKDYKPNVATTTDPRGMPALDLSTPEPTSGQRETIMLNQAYNDMLEALKPDVAEYRNYSEPADYAADYRARFEKVASIIASIAPAPVAAATSAPKN